MTKSADDHFNTHNQDPNRWQKSDTTWTLSLFGTAVGAGVLFLPINAGLGGVWPLILLTILVAPMTYFAHRNLSRLVIGTVRDGEGLTEVVTEYFGPRAGTFLTLLYFFSIYPILLIYGVGITNTVEDFLVYNLHRSAPNRALLAALLILILMVILHAGERWILKVTQWIVYPLVIMLSAISLYLIPHWSLAPVIFVPTRTDFIKTVWLTIPVLVFSFNHSPAISLFSLAQRRDYGAEADRKAMWILQRTSTILLFFVMSFVISCVLSLSPEEMALAKQENTSILSFLGKKLDNSLMALLGPAVALLAIISSFFGHYAGAHEGLQRLVTVVSQRAGINHQGKLVKGSIAIFLALSIWGAATLNPNILQMIESLSGPVVAALLFVMPIYSFCKVPQLRRYREPLSDLFTLLMGLAAISAIIYSFI